MSTITHQHTKNVLTVTFIDKIVHCIKCMFNAVLNFHDSQVCQQIAFSLLEFNFWCHGLNTVQVWPIAHNKHFMRYRSTATALNRHPFLGFIRHDDKMSSLVRAPLKKEM